jgi:hypothetical protein
MWLSHYRMLAQIGANESSRPWKIARPDLLDQGTTDDEMVPALRTA